LLRDMSTGRGEGAEFEIHEDQDCLQLALSASAVRSHESLYQQRR